MQRIGLKLLTYVEAAATCGNVSAAARQLHVSQSSVSAAIAELETLIGVPIFVRHHARGVSLTPAGNSLINDARQLLKHAQDFEKAALNLSSETTGEVSLGCFVTLAARFMPRLLATFSEAYPGISVKLMEGSQDEVVEMMLSGRIELALSYSSALRPEIDAKFLGELLPHALLPMTHPLASSATVSLRDLVDTGFILLDLPFSTEYFLNLFRLADCEPRIVYRSRSPEFIRGLVAHGHGFTIHNAVTRNTVANDGTPIAVVPLRDKLPGARVMCLRLQQHNLRPAVRVLERFIMDAFSDSLRQGPDGLHRI